MNKILELVEKYMNTTSDYDYIKLAIAIDNRKILEQTPITEDWLKAHGFHISDELHSKRDKIYIKEDIKVYLDVDCRNGIIGNVDCIEINGYSNSFHKDSYDNGGRITLATLYDACELCDIKID